MLDEVGSQAAAQSEMLASSEMQEAMAAKLRALIVQMGLFFFKEKERIKTNLAVSELSPEIAKSIAAHQAGCRIIIIPRDNLRDLTEIPDTVKRDIKFYPVTDMSEVLKLALKT